MLEALIEIEDKTPKNPRLHEHYAHLAFVYKDIPNPQWKKALELIDKAISEYKRSNSNLSDLVLYHFNKIICYINLKIEGIDTEEDYDIEEDFEWVWSVEQGRDMLMTIPQLLAPNLREWMIEHKRERVVEWLKQHSNKQMEDWLNS